MRTKTAKVTPKCAIKAVSCVPSPIKGAKVKQNRLKTAEGNTKRDPLPAGQTLGNTLSNNENAVSSRVDHAAADCGHKYLRFIQRLRRQGSDIPV